MGVGNGRRVEKFKSKIFNLKSEIKFMKKFGIASK
jgi:hypothetical protein